MKEGRLKFWIIGSLTAFAGVGVVKFLALHYPCDRVVVMLAGYTLTISGLFIIMLGTRRKD